MHSMLGHNGYVYETFGISKHFPVKLQVLLIRAEILNNALIAKCFIYDVANSIYFNINALGALYSVFKLSNSVIDKGPKTVLLSLIISQ